MGAHQDKTVGLTEKNMSFIRAVILDVDSGKAKAEHYRAVFGSKASERSLHKMASRLWSAPALQAYADEVRKEVKERFMVTVEQLIEELEEARQVGLSERSASPMVAATMGKAKLAGLDKQIIEHRGDVPVGAVTIEVVSARPENNSD